MSKSSRKAYREAFASIYPSNELILKTIASPKPNCSSPIHKTQQIRKQQSLSRAIAACFVIVACVFCLATLPFSKADAKDLRFSVPTITISGPNSLAIDTYKDCAVIYVKADFSCENAPGEPYRVKFDNNILAVLGEGSFSSEWSNELTINPNDTSLGTIKITVNLSSKDKKTIESNSDADDAIARILFSCLIKLKETTITLENKEASTVYKMSVPEFSSWEDLRSTTVIDVNLIEQNSEEFEK